MKIANYTTEKTVRQTAQDLEKILIENGAKTLHFEYENGIHSVVVFVVATPSGDRAIKMPCEWLKMRQRLDQAIRSGEVKVKRNIDLDDYSKRIAWRQIYWWVKAQMDLLSTSMVKIEQIFLPYMVDSRGQTFFEVIEKKQFSLPE